MIKNKITIAVVEDQKEIRDNLVELINSTDDLFCTAVYPDAEKALKDIPALKPSIIFMDINLPGESGIECVKKIKPLLPETQIIMLTMFDNSEKVFNALENGATGYLLKRTPPEKILDAAREAFNGGSPMSMQIARLVVKSFSQKNKNVEVHSKLSTRELEILEQLSKGKRYNEIADTLFINIETVRSHLRRIYEKLHVRSGTEAVLKYLKNK